METHLALLNFIAKIKAKSTNSRESTRAKVFYFSKRNDYCREKVQRLTCNQHLIAVLDKADA